MSSWASKLDKDARAPGAVRQQSQHATDIISIDNSHTFMFSKSFFQGLNLKKET